MKEITLVEGYFDAQAAFLDGFPNPIAIQGIYVTDLQLQMIRKLLPDTINVYFDKKELGNKMRQRLYRNLPTVSRVNVFNAWGSDPEERLLWKITHNGAEYLQSLVNTVNNYATSSPI